VRTPTRVRTPLIYIKQLRGDKPSRLEYRASEALLGKDKKKSKNSILTAAIGPLGCGKPLNVFAGPDLFLRETSEFICWAGVKPYVGLAGVLLHRLGGSGRCLWCFPGSHHPPRLTLLPRFKVLRGHRVYLLAVSVRVTCATF